MRVTVYDYAGNSYIRNRTISEIFIELRRVTSI